MAKSSTAAPAAKAVAVRFYKVEDASTGGIWLVEAATPAAALKRVTQPQFNVSLASHSDMLSADATVLRANDAEGAAS